MKATRSWRAGGFQPLVGAHPGRVLAGQPFLFSFFSSSTGAFSDGGGLLVVLTVTRFCENTGFLTGAAKSAQDGVKWLIRPDFD